jgi:hypothetical protein
MPNNRSSTRTAASPHRRVRAALAFALTFASSLPAAHAQFVPKVPPATPPTPEYVPPPEPKPDPGLGATPDRPAGGAGEGAASPGAKPMPSIPEALPSLIELDAAGKIKALPIPTDLAALRSMKLTPEQSARVAEAIANRESQVDRLVAANPDRALALRSALATLDEMNDLSKLFGLRETSGPLMPQTAFLESLVRSGALTVPQRTRIDQAVKEYDSARRKQWQQDLGENEVVAISTLIARDKIRQFSYEPMASLDRLLTSAAASADKIRDDRTISESARAAMPKANEKDAAKFAASFKSWFFALKSPEDQAAVIKSVAPAAP